MKRILELAKEKLIPGESVRDRAIIGSIWLFGMRFFGRGLQLIKLAVLARILAPSDFGLMGIALLGLGVMEQFSKLGFSAALVQREEENVDEFLDTAWMLKIARGVLLGTAAFLLAPLIARFFGDPRVTDLIRVLAVIPVLNGLANPGVVYFQKHMEFHKKFAYESSKNVVNFTAALLYALAEPTVWALVVGNVVEAFFGVFVSFVLHGYRPSIRFDLGRAKELFNYGKWITLTGVFVFLLNQGDDAFVGWYLGAAALGFYQMAFRFGNAPTTELTQVLSNVLLSTFSKVQNDVDQLRNVFDRSFQLLAFISFPAAVGIVIVAPIFVPVILGDQWTQMVPALQILAVWGGFRSLYPIYNNLFQALNRPDIRTKFDAFRLVIMGVLIIPLSDLYGTAGTAAAVTIPAALSVVIASYYGIKVVEKSGISYLYEISYPLTCTFVMGAVVFVVRETVLEAASLGSLVGLVLVGAVAYIVATYILSRVSSYGIWSTVSVAMDGVR